MSTSRRPALENKGLFMKILSVKVAELFVIRVSFKIDGKKPNEYIVFKKSDTDVLGSELNKLMLKSPSIQTVGFKGVLCKHRFST